MGDDEMLALSHVQDALLSAATAGLKKVIVGKYRHVAVWQGSSYLTIPDGLTLDLCGAEVRSLLNAPVLEFAGAGTVCNGTVAIAGGTRVANTIAGNLAVFENVRFVRAGQAAPTAASSTNAETPVSFIGCTNVTLAPPAVGAVVRKQSAVGCNGVYEVGSATDVAQIASANATGTEVGSLVRTALAALGVAPSVTPPFAGTTEAAEAVKQMWFDKIPDIESALGNSVVTQFQWNGARGALYPNGDPAKASATITAYGGTSTVVNSYSLLNLERKACVLGTGLFRRLAVSCAGSIAIEFQDSDHYVSASIVVDFTDMQAAYKVAFPSAPDIFQFLSGGGSASASFNNMKGTIAYRNSSDGTYVPIYALGYRPAGEEDVNFYFYAQLVSSGVVRFAMNEHAASAVANSLVLQFQFEIDMPARISANHYSSEDPSFASIDGLAYNVVL